MYASDAESHLYFSRTSSILSTLKLDINHIFRKIYNFHDFIIDKRLKGVDELTSSCC